jgi:integrase
VDVVKELADEIDGIIEENGTKTIFSNGNKGHLGINSINTAFKDIAVKAGISAKYSSYSLRKFAARNLLLKYKMDVAKVQNILGHSESVWDVYYYYDRNRDKVDQEKIWWEFPSEAMPSPVAGSVAGGDYEAILGLVRTLNRDDRKRLMETTMREL